MTDIAHKRRQLVAPWLEMGSRTLSAGEGALGLGLGVYLGASGGGGGGPAPSTLLDGLVSYWRFDESSGNAEDAVGSNDLTNNGTVTYAAGKINNAAASLSDTNYLSAAHSASLDLFDKDFSISLWATNTGANTRVALCKGTASGASTNQITIGRSNTAPTGIYCELGSGAANLLITGEPFTAWLRHVVVTFNKTTKLLSIYVDNVKYTKTITGVVPNASGDLRVGRFYAGGFPIVGMVDELALWSRVLTDAEVTELYNSGAGEAYPFDAVAPSTLDQLIILGDSTIAAFLGQNSVGSYLSYAGAGGVVSLAVPGDTINNQRTAWRAGNRLRADIVCVQVGLNDTNPAEAASVAIARLQALVTQINSDCPNARIMIGTMTPCRQRLIDLYGGTDGPIAYQKWLDINEAIAGNGGTPITGVDARATSHTTALNDGSGNLAAAYEISGTDDHIHENNAGRQIIAAAWQAQIDAL